MPVTQPRYITISDFSPGQNNEFDPRRLRPVSSDDTSAEAVRAENYDIVAEGALITAPGFEEVIDLGTGQPALYIGQYTYDSQNRYRIAVSNQQAFQLRKFDFVTLHDCDEFNSGTYGTWANGGGMSSVSTNTSTHIRGDGAVSGSGSGASGAAYFEVTRPSTADISSYDYVELYAYMSNLNDTDTPTANEILGTVKIRIGSSSSDYYEQSFSTAEAHDFIADEWHGFRFNIQSPGSATGSPDLSAVDYIRITWEWSGGNGTLASTTFIIDNIIATKSSDTLRAVDISGHSWGGSVTATYPQVNGVNYTGKNSFPLLVLANNSEAPLKVRHVGPDMLISDEISGAPSNCYMVQEMLGFLFFAKDRTVTYSAPEDETDYSTGNGGGVIAFQSNIRGLAPTVNKSLLVTCEDKVTKEVSFQFDDTNVIFFPVKGEYQAGVGGLSHKSIVPRYNDTMFLGNEGVSYFGQTEQQVRANYVADSLSWKVDRLINNIQRDASEVSAGGYFGRKKQYWIGMPIGLGQEINNQFFVYHSQYDSWSYRSGMRFSHVAEVREDDNYEFYMADAVDDKIYKLNNFYDYAGDAYTRRYVTKVFNMGLPTIYKQVPWIEIAGAMPAGSEFYVKAISDGQEKVFKVDDTCLLLEYQDPAGFIGGGYYGDEFFGGDLTEAEITFTPYRFYTRIALPKSIREGREFQFEFYNHTTGQPHKIDFFRIKYTLDAEEKLPAKHHNNEIVAPEIVS